MVIQSDFLDAFRIRLTLGSMRVPMGVCPLVRSFFIYVVFIIAICALFADTCLKYNCPELTVCFCHVDDADLHPNLCRNRTQYMGGGEFCDFDIFVKE